MEMDPKDRSRLWWQGAVSNAVKGIPQGILLGAFGFALLIGLTYGFAAVGAFGLASVMMQGLGGFLFSPVGAEAISASIAAGSVPAFNFALLSPLPFVALNTMLTIAGNFLVGGDTNVTRHLQEFDHDQNVKRLDALEGRGHMVEYTAGKQSAAVQSILSRGKRNESFARTEEIRVTTAPTTKTLQ